MATTMALVTNQATRTMKALTADERRFCLGEDGQLSRPKPQGE
jgi:hypothetical protein